MTTKIKVFRGSLKPIFNDGIKNDLDTALDIPNGQAAEYLPIDHIRPRADQPRKIFNELSLLQLTQSIKSKGVIQPIIVKPSGDGFYDIIVGERRWRAAKMAGLDKIAVIVREYNKSETIAVALIENIQRENLNPLEEAEAIHRLIDECAMTHHQVADNIGRSRTAVSNLLRLLTLTEEVKVMINAGLLEMGHARALLSLPDEQQIEVAKWVAAKSLSVRETEKLVQRMNMLLQEKPTIVIDPDFESRVAAWQTRLSKQLSSKVNVHLSPEGKGRVVIHFESVEEADWLMAHIGLTNDQGIV